MRMKSNLRKVLKRTLMYQGYLLIKNPVYSKNRNVKLYPVLDPELPEDFRTDPRRLK